MENFCNSTFWDDNLTWNTTRPDLSSCFQQTVLIWIPFVLLLGLVGFNLCNNWMNCWRKPLLMTKSSKLRKCHNSHLTKRLIVTRLFVGKTSLCCGLVLMHLINLVQLNYEDASLHRASDANWVAVFIRILGYIFALILIVHHKITGVTSSGGMFIYWLLLLCCDILIFQSALRNEQNNVHEMTRVVNIFQFPLVVLTFVINCWADNVPISRTSKNNAKPCPDQTASFLSKLLFYWYEELAWIGYKRPLEISDLWDLNERETCDHQVPKFYKNWLGPKDGKCKAPDGRSLKGNAFFSPLKALGQTFLLGTLFQFGGDMLGFASPEILKLLISFTKTKDMETWKGYFFVTVLLLSSTLQTVFITQFMQVNLLLYMRMKTMLMSAIYRKALRISSIARKNSSVGEIVNLMSVDALKLLNALAFLNELWSAPLKIFVSMYLLWNILGHSVLAGVFVMILLISVNGLLGKFVRNLQAKQMKHKDQRVKLMSEILAGIKVLKLYAFEPPFENEVMDVRRKELKLLKRAAYLNAAKILVGTCAPFFVSLVTFGMFVLVDENNVLDAEKAFVSLALFNIMKEPLNNFPVTIVSLIEASVAVKRINRFLNAEERDADAIEQKPEKNSTCNLAISIQNADFSWDPSEDAFRLKNINLNVKQGSILGIVGTVGTGKSSLLAAILGEMFKTSGRVMRHGKVAYVAQQAWIQNCSLRDNILFGEEFHEETYQKVIEACALQPDIDMLPAGDRTEIGEKGVTLSGGQKQRVSIARAVYSKSDLILLDDPLSSVDAHVSKHLFDKVLGPNGLLKHTTRLLVTHSLKYLKHIDNIVVMKDGEISEEGTYDALLESGAAFSDFLNQYSQETEEEEEHVPKSTVLVHSLPRQISESASQRSHSPTKRSTTTPIKRRISSSLSASSAISLHALELISDNDNTDDVYIDDEAPPLPIPEQQRLIKSEKMEVGTVQRDVYLNFIKSMGIVTAIMALVFNAFFQALQMGSSIWLAKWADDDDNHKNPSNSTTDHDSTENNNNNLMYLSVYGLFGLGQATTIMIGTVCMSLAILNASSILHQRMLSRIMRAPMSFFETTPVGRIVNRFAKDLDNVDFNLGVHLRSLIPKLFSLVATVIIISINMPAFLLAIFVLSIIYCYITKFYVASKGQLKRMESISMSPIFSQFSETLSGTATIRGYGAEDRFVRASDNRIDFHQKCYYPAIVGNRWLAVRLEAVSNIMVFLAGVLAVINRDKLDPGTVGLSICYAMQVTSTLNWMVRMISAIETDAISAERIIEFSETEQEADWIIGEQKPPKDWPDKGAISFKNCQARYRPGLDLVLRNLSCEILPGEKIGCTSRTGSGKSTLMLVLLRIIEPVDQNSIIIDGLDISKLALHDIRGRITIIPQDPVLFSGTLRMNMDPFSKYEDAEIWRVLELAHLKEFVITQCPDGLLHKVSEGGDNLSMGQKQLICLARALLRKNQILLLDEATASVDLETDLLIQKTIRTEFQDATVLCIAHRLNTIMDYDRVMVLKDGQIAELDKPETLLKDENSIFYSLAKADGVV